MVIILLFQLSRYEIYCLFYLLLSLIHFTLFYIFINCENEGPKRLAHAQERFDKALLYLNE